MNILMVFHAPPYPPDLGPSRRHYHQLVELLARGHRVSVLSYGTEEDLRAFRSHFGDRCQRVEFVTLHDSTAGKTLRRAWIAASGRSDFARLLTRRLQRALDRMVAAEPSDVVMFSTTMLGGLRLPPGVPLVGDTHNIEFDNLRRAFEETTHPLLREYFRWQAALTKREEVAFTRKFDVVCTTSARDRQVLGAAVPDADISVVPNGVALDAEPLPTGAREPGTIVFTGLMSYYPNRHGVAHFLRDIFPQVIARAPHARIMIVGAGPPQSLLQAANERITVTGYVASVRPYLHRADVYVIPLRIGGGTRVKALQAMAAGAPIVSTRIGCEGLGVRDGEQALLADDPADFARAIVRLMNDQALRERLVAQAREHVHAFDWTRIGDTLEHTLLAAARRQPGPCARPLKYETNPG